MSKELAKTKVKCPQCGSQTLRAHELREMIRTYFIFGGTVDLKDYDEDYGVHTGVEIDCMACGHSWRKKNAATIDGMIDGMIES